MLRGTTLVIVLAMSCSLSPNTLSGEALPAYVELAWITAGGGTVIYGKAPGDELIAGSASGDVNGDGFDDLVVGASQVIGDGKSGELYVLYGPLPEGVIFDLASLDGTNGFVLHGPGPGGGSQVFPTSGAGACDVNGDGYHEIFAGSGKALGEAGQTYVIFGRPDFPAVFDLSELDGSNGVAFDGIDPGDFASKIDCAGDTNGDGLDDLIIGAFEGGGGLREGQAYLVLGRESYDAGQVPLEGARPPFGETFEGKSFAEEFGESVSGAGDIDGDGFQDILIGAPFAEHMGGNIGEAYLLYGRKDFPPPPSRPRVVFHGESAGDQNGADVAAAGDVNGDGFDDLLVGSWQVDFGNVDRSGATYVVYGRPDLPESVELGELNGDNGFAIYASVSTSMGNSVARGADINGDGYSDIITGAQNADPWWKDSAGATYVIFGGPDIPAVVIANELDGENGFRVHGETDEDRTGGTLTTGDLNADGRADLVIGGVFGGPDGNDQSGVVYILFEPVEPEFPWVIFPPKAP